MLAHFSPSLRESFFLTRGGENFGKNFRFLGGGTTTPLLSAECQIAKKSAVKLDTSRV